MARYLVYYLAGDPVPHRMKMVDDATGPPTAGDDAATMGVTVGSIWLDQTNHATYICYDASTGAAVWSKLQAVDFAVVAASSAAATAGADPAIAFPPNASVATATATAIQPEVVVAPTATTATVTAAAYAATVQTT